MCTSIIVFPRHGPAISNFFLEIKFPKIGEKVLSLSLSLSAASLDDRYTLPSPQLPVANRSFAFSLYGNNSIFSRVLRGLRLKGSP